jgi:lipopolysaccharide export system protein LptA
MRRLLDSVVFKHQGAIMYCDSAWHFFKENKFEAFSNVYINQGDTLHLYGDHLDYIGSEDQAFVDGNVVLKDPQMTLRTSRIKYNLNTKIASYKTGANIINKENKLYSLKGYYNSNDKNLTFKKNVVLDNLSYNITCDTLLFNTKSETAYFIGPTNILSSSNYMYCENGWYNTQTDISQFSKNAFLQNGNQKLYGDSLYYNKNIGYGLALINVQLEDTLNDYFINGNKAEVFELNDSSIITDQTLLTLLFENDTLFLHADTITATIDSLKSRTIKAFTGVKFFSNSLQGKCEHLHYYKGDSTIQMYEKPILWSEDNQLTSTHISIQLSNNNIDQLRLTENAFISSQESPTLFNQIKGKNITGFFRNSALNKVKVVGNGQTVYVIKDNEEKISGVNTIKCSHMNIDVINKKLKRISFQDNPDGIIYPVVELPEFWRLLEGFKWRGDEIIKEKSDIY